MCALDSNLASMARTLYMCDRVDRSIISEQYRACSKDSLQRHGNFLSGQESQLLHTFEYGELTASHGEGAFTVQVIKLQTVMVFSTEPKFLVLKCPLPTQALYW